MGALYDHEQQVIFVRRGMTADDIFRSVSKEVAHAELAAVNDNYTREGAAFAAYSKRYGFRLECADCDTVHVFEAAIDALSFGTLMLHWGQDWRCTNLLSQGGAAVPSGGLPLALASYIAHRQPKKVILHYDNDKAGRNAAASVISAIPQGIMVEDKPPPMGNDVNDMLCWLLSSQRNASAP